MALAETCLRSALAADPEHGPSRADAAWYASDRGDAAAAARFLERAAAAEDEDGDGEDGRLRLLRELSAESGPATHIGRNAPRPCGSGRKCKQCWLARPEAATRLPLERRVRWLWEKMCWWMERTGLMDEVASVAYTLLGEREPDSPVELTVSLDTASSLVLFAGGAVADFLAERSALLPGDEANLVTQWAPTSPSVHEVGGVRSGEGFDLRDLRSGDVVRVAERSGSRSLQDHDLVFAHPVFDGVGYQVVGGIVPVTMQQRDLLLALLDQERGARAIAEELARTRRPPTLASTEGEPTVLCEGTYCLDEPVGAGQRLDAVWTRQSDGGWAELPERGGDRVVRATASIEGDTLTVSANSLARFERAKQAVSAALGPLEVLGETRETLEEATRRVRSEGGEGTSAVGFPGVELPADAAEVVASFLREREVAWLASPCPVG